MAGTMKGGFLMDLAPIKADLENAKTVFEDMLPSALDDASKEGVIEFTRAFVQLRDLKDHIEACLKPFEKLYEDMKTTRLPAAFEAAGVPTVNLDEGFRVTIAHNVRASIKAGQKEPAMQWLRDNELGDVISETINSSTLSAVAKSMAEENRELDADLFNVYVMPTTSVTKTKT